MSQGKKVICPDCHNWVQLEPDYNPTKDKHDLMMLVARAELGRGSLTGDGITRSVGGAILKAVLCVIAAYEGENISVQAIADRVSANSSSVACAIGYLRRAGYLETVKVSNRPSIYRLNRKLLEASKCKDPLSLTPRVKGYRSLSGSHSPSFGRSSSLDVLAPPSPTVPRRAPNRVR